jgi:hypothetical protein
VIDAIWVPSSVHFAMGATVVVATLAAWLAALVQALRNRPLPRWVHGLFIAAQLSLAVQVLLGIKLLDQGLGPLQLYVHYLGGTGPLLFFLVYYWAPPRVRAWRASAPLLSGLAFLFVLMAFGIGESYDPAA